MDVKIHKDDLILFEELGRGGYGCVLRAKHKEYQWHMAIKYFQSSEDSAKLEREAKKMMELRHNSIVTIYGLVEAKGSPFVGVAMEYMAGGNIPQTKKRIKEEIPIVLLNQWNYQIAKGIDFIHEEGFIHKDIKAINVLVDGKLKAKICDFELCRKIEQSPNTMEVLGTPRATLTHQPPECLHDIKKCLDFDPKFDIYSFGITMFEVYVDDSQIYPSEYLKNEALLNYAVPNGERPDLKRISKVEPKVINLMKKCWGEDPRNRPSAKEIVQVLSEVCKPQESAARTEADRLSPLIAQDVSWDDKDGESFDKTGFSHDGQWQVFKGPVAAQPVSQSPFDNRVWRHLTDEEAEHELSLQRNHINLHEKEGRVVSATCLQSLANQIGPKDFRNIGRCLLFEEYELDSFHHDYERLGIAEVNTKMLFKWKEANDTDATYEWLATACLSLKRNDLIDTLMKA